MSTEPTDFTVARLTELVTQLAGDDDNKLTAARKLWSESGLPSDASAIVEQAVAADFLGRLRAELRRSELADQEETNTAMRMDEARQRLLSACGYDAEIVDVLIEEQLRPRSSFGLVPGSLVHTLVAQLAIAAVDTRPSPTQAPLRPIKKYDHISITTAASAKEPMMDRYRLSAEFPGAGREPTGFEKFDNEIALKPSTVTVVAGREGAGKSAFMLQAAANMSVRGPVIYVLTEMSREDVWKRLAACFGHIEKWKLEHPREDTLEAAEITHTWMAKHLNLHVVDAAGVPMKDGVDRNGVHQPGLITVISDLVESLGGVRAVFVDNLWGIAHANGELGKVSMSVALGSITKLLRECASGMMWDCPIVLAHHLNREGAPSTLAKGKEQGGPSGPATENLGGSDQIGFDAEAVVLLVKEPREDQGEKYDEEAHAEGDFIRAKRDWDKVTCHITKNRNGQPGKKLYMRFVGAQQRFEEDHEEATPGKPRTIAVDKDTTRDDAAQARRKAMAPL